jgi:hypothetical protein
MIRDRSRSQDQPLTGRLPPPERQLGQAFVFLQVAYLSLHVQPAGAPAFIAAGHSARHWAAMLAHVCACAAIGNANVIVRISNVRISTLPVCKTES